MSPLAMTTEEINRRGCSALVKALGPAGYVRFMRQFLGSDGDYTQRRFKSVPAIDLSDLQERFGRPGKSRTAQRRTGK